MRSQDKLHEAQFFLGHMQEQSKRFQDTADPTSLHHFRYYFSAFFSAARSVTFTLQSQYRSVKGEDFDKWYKQQIEELSKLPFAKQFLDIRNITQKQGNRLPLIKVEAKVSDGVMCYVTYDLTREGALKGATELAIKLGEETNFGFQSSSDLSEEEWQKKSIEIFSEVLSSITASLQQPNELTSKSHLLVIDDKNTTVSFEEFLSMCNQYIQALERIVLGAITEFDLYDKE